MDVIVSSEGWSSETVSIHVTSVTFMPSLKESCVATFNRLHFFFFFSAAGGGGGGCVSTK